MKKLLCLLLAVMFALAGPQALAWEDSEPPLWRLARYADRGTFADYLEENGLTEVEYACMANWVNRYRTVHPEWESLFDADAWFEKKLCAPPGNPSGKANWFADQLPGYTEADFQKEMRYLYLTGRYERDERTRKGSDVSGQYPEAFAAFDADAWFAGYYGAVVGITKTDYLTQKGLDEAGFRRDMFGEWAAGQRGRYGGAVVTVDGAPIIFETVNYDGGSASGAVAGRIYAPLPALERALGFQSTYDPDARTLLCAKGDRSVRFALDSLHYSVTDGARTEARILDAIPPFDTNSYPYLPLRALAEALGCGVEWNGLFSTACVTTNPDKD